MIPTGRLLWLIALIQVCFGAQVDVQNTEVLVLPGQNASFMCRVGTQLQYCRAEIPGMKPVNLIPKRQHSAVTYYGSGLESGQCGFVISRVKEENNGIIKCTLGLIEEASESVGTMHLVVARAPKIPELDLSRGTDRLTVYKINDVLHASCIVKDGRPVANITFFLDDEPLYGEGLSMPTVIDLAKENLQSKVQNITRVLQASDNGKRLRCVAYHPGFSGGRAETGRQLDIKYPPLPHPDPIDLFGYQLGQGGSISVDIEANPKPQIEWNIDGQRIKEGSVDNTGRIEAEAAQDLGKGRYKVNLRIAAISKLDTEKEYQLTAYNDMGSQLYRIKISTSPEPEGLELGIGSIIGIVVGVLILILIVSMLVFAKVTGRWCFTGSEGNIAESSDTESAEEDRTKRRLPPIKLTALFKKNKDKVASEDQEEPKQIQDELKVPLEGAEVAKDAQEQKDGLVYAELDLVSPNLKPVVKNDGEKTEYAEIVYTKEDDKPLKK